MISLISLINDHLKSKAFIILLTSFIYKLIENVLGHPNLMALIGRIISLSLFISCAWIAFICGRKFSGLSLIYRLLILFISTFIIIVIIKLSDTNLLFTPLYSVLCMLSLGFIQNPKNSEERKMKLCIVTVFTFIVLYVLSIFIGFLFLAIASAH